MAIFFTFQLFGRVNFVNARKTVFLFFLGFLTETPKGALRGSRARYARSLRSLRLLSDLASLA